MLILSGWDNEVPSLKELSVFFIFHGVDDRRIS